MTEEQKPVRAEDVNLIKDYNEFLEEIPWKSLQTLPKKLERWASLIGIKDSKDLDFVDPIKRVVEFMGVLVKRLRTSEKRVQSLEKRIEALEKA